MSVSAKITLRGIDAVAAAVSLTMQVVKVRLHLGGIDFS
jgi:hypothetical protein